MQEFVTDIRLKKMIDLLREYGTITNSPQDIPTLAAAMLHDIRAEDAAYATALEPHILSRRVSQKVSQLFLKMQKEQ